MQITDEQRQLLSTLHCERLSSSQRNFDILNTFNNYKNESIAHVLHDSAYENDDNGVIAYYIIKNEEDDIFFYFSLKCGQLYDRAMDAKVYDRMNALYHEMIEQGRDQGKEIGDKEIINSLIEDIRSQKGIDKSKLDSIKSKTKTIKEFLELIADSKEKVGFTFSGIEIVEFCANDDIRGKWQEWNFTPKMGVVMFWNFLVPIVLKIKELVGCEYLFLFAADKSDEAELVKYYMDLLKFDMPQGISANVPVYDLDLPFLCQKVSSLEQKQRDFFNDFNPDPEEK